MPNSNKSDLDKYFDTVKIFAINESDLRWIGQSHNVSVPLIKTRLN